MAAAYKATDCLSSSKVTFKISSFPSPEKTRFIKTTKFYTATQSQYK